MKNRTLVLLIAVIMLGLFALPNALSLFSGQHSFDKAGNGTICTKCHSDVAAELAGSAYHTTMINDANGYQCKACHSAGTINAGLIPTGNQTNGSSGINAGLNLLTGNFTYANGTNVTYTLHAAVTVECVSCHYAVNFTDDAHRIFADNATQQPWLKGANEACVGCHTKARVEMTWVRKGGYSYEYDVYNRSGTMTFNNTNVTTNTTNY